METCLHLRQEYTDLKALKQEFDLACDEVVRTGDLTQAKALKAELEVGRDTLKAKLWPLEQELPQAELSRQYESQKEILIKTNILEKLSTGELGIKGIDNKEYPYPTLKEITERLKAKQEKLKTKIEQGFNQLLIVPFGMSLDNLIEKYKQVILKHHQENKLFATKKDPSDPDEPLELDENLPIWQWDGYNDADTNGNLVYHPKKFDKNDHRGQTKQEILNQTHQGFNILLIENNPNIPRAGQGKTIKNRKQLEAGKSPIDYLNILNTDPQYQYESGMTPEEQIMLAIIYLEQNDQVIDDYSVNGSASCQLGAFFFTSGNVPYAFWRRDFRQAHLNRESAGHIDAVDGVRGAVRESQL
jgi:hypothetical protein